VILLALFACVSGSTGASPDLEAYLQASEEIDWVQGLKHCHKIQEPDRLGECVAFQVQQGAREQPDAAKKACSELVPGLWKDECYFLLAEAITVAEAPTAAASACKSAGRYFQPCFMHLLKAHAGHLRSSRPATEVFSAYKAALDLAGPNAPADFRHRAWSLFFRSAAAQGPALDPESCEGFAEQGAACRSGLREALSRALSKAMREASPEQRQSACAFNPPDAAHMAPALGELFEINIRPHPLFDAPLAQWARQHCSK
jgi:hypothetical protein